MKAFQQSYSHRLLLLPCLGLLMFFVSCTKPDKRMFVPHPALAEIDSLLWSQPDSAFMELQRFAESSDVDSLEVFDGHYFQLLLSELLYKNDYAQTNREELLKAVGYFDSLVMADAHGAYFKDAHGASLQQGRNAFLDARCHYINGVGYYETDSVVPACQEYLKAVELMEDRFKEKELTGKKAQFMALAYTRLTMLFSNQYLPEQALHFAKQSLPYYLEEDTSSWQVTWVLGMIGTNYHVLSKLDSASYYYHLVERRLTDTNSIQYRDITSQLAYLSYQKTGLSESILDSLHIMLSKATSEKEYLARCLTLGEIHYHEHSFDSAWYYLEKVFSNVDRLGSKKQAAEWLMDICKAQGRENEFLEYSNYLGSFVNLEEYKSVLKSQLTELYKNHVQEQQKRQHLKMKRQERNWVIIVFAVVFALLFTLLYYYRAAKRKRLELETKFKEEKLAFEMKQKAISGRLKKSNETLRHFVKKSKEQQTQKMPEKRTSKIHDSNQYETFLHESICKEVIDKAKQFHKNPKTTLKTNMDFRSFESFALSTTQLVSLSKTVQEHFPCLYDSLKAKYSSFDQKDWQYCLLYLLRLDKLDVCVLLQVPYYSCRRHIMKLESVFHCENGLTLFLVQQVISINS